MSYDDELLESKHINVDANFIAKPPSEDLMKGHQFLLVRHAVTEFNLEYARIAGTYGSQSKQYKKFIVDHKYIDIEIRPEGVIQCEKA